MKFVYHNDIKYVVESDSFLVNAETYEINRDIRVIDCISENEYIQMKRIETLEQKVDAFAQIIMLGGM